MGWGVGGMGGKEGGGKEGGGKEEGGKEGGGREDLLHMQWNISIIIIYYYSTLSLCKTATPIITAH